MGYGVQPVAAGVAGTGDVLNTLEAEEMLGGAEAPAVMLALSRRMFRSEVQVCESDLEIQEFVAALCAEWG